jgi:hypothetical protein
VDRRVHRRHPRGVPPHLVDRCRGQPDEAVNSKSRHYRPTIPAEDARKADHDIEATHRMPLPGPATATKPDVDRTK